MSTYNNLFDFLDAISIFNKDDIEAVLQDGACIARTKTNSFFISKKDAADQFKKNEHLVNFVNCHVPFASYVIRDHKVWNAIVSYAFTKEFQKLVKLKAFL